MSTDIEVVNFGLAPIKAEGTGVRLDSKFGGEHKHSETTWIEMCYDPDEPVNAKTLEALSVAMGSIPLNEDEIYNLVKAFAYKFTEHGGA